MKQLIISLFGAYVPLTSSDGTIVSSIAGLDFVWLAGVLLFGLTLYCVFRIVGGLLK